MPLKIYGQKSTAAFWAKNLEGDTPFRKPDEFFLSIISKYINQNGKTLDGGCGLGYLVAYLSSLGYDAIGIDFSKTLIKSARMRTHTNAELHVGDLLTYLTKKIRLIPSFLRVCLSILKKGLNFC